MASTSSVVALVLENVRAFQQTGLAAKSGHEHGVAARREDVDSFWAPLFQQCFVDTHDVGRDDLIFFVRRKDIVDKRQSLKEPFFVLRKTSKNLPPIGDETVNWEETFNLNLILNQMEFLLVVAVCKQDKRPWTKIVSKKTQPVYASPSSRKMDGKGENEEITYPNIFFTVDNFDEVFAETVLQEDECLAVEVLATVRNADVTDRSVVFQGVVEYQKLYEAFFRTQRATRKKGQKQPLEFLMLRGPKGKGRAQVAMSIRLRDDAPGAETPTTPAMSEPAFADETPEPSPTARSGGFRFSLNALRNFGQSVKSRVTGVAKMALEQVTPAGPPEMPPAGECMLNSFITYVSLPWHSIVHDVIGRRVISYLHPFTALPATSVLEGEERKGDKPRSASAAATPTAAAVPVPVRRDSLSPEAATVIAPPSSDAPSDMITEGAVPNNSSDAPTPADSVPLVVSDAPGP